MRQFESIYRVSRIEQPAQHWSAVLRALREAAGVTQEGWAARLGFGRRTIQRWEHGDLLPDSTAAEALIRLCSELRLFRDYNRGILAGATLTADGLGSLLADARLGPPLNQRLVPEALKAEAALPDPGEPPERIWPVVHPDLATDVRPLSKLAHPNNLTAQVTPLIGRGQERADVQRRLLEPGVRLLTLTGAGGIGKTRLALQVAADVLEHFVDGVFVAPLAAIRDAALVLPTIAQILGVRERSGTALQQTLENFLRDKSLLLVLDNFEQVLPAAVSVAELLVSCPQLKVLATSRASLRIYGEHVISVPTLRMPAEPWPTPEQLSQYDAVQLLVERARAVRPDLAVTDATAPAIAAICARLDGLPLAIELAAARLKLLTLEALLARLSQRFELLVGGPRDRPPRQQTLNATLQWSFDLVDPQQKTLFRRLGVFIGGCTLEAAEWVCASEGQSRLEVLGGLGGLVDQSLLQQQAHVADDQPRFVMLETIGEFALEQLNASGEADAIRRRHVDYFIKLGERAEPELHAGPEHVRWIGRLDREKHNLRAAFRWCIENREVERGLQLGGAVWHYWYLVGSFNETRDWHQGLLRLLPGAGRTMLVARSLNAAGMLSIVQGDFPTAKALYEESLTIGRELVDRGGIALSLNNLGMLALREGDSQLAQLLLEDAVAESRAAGDLRKEANSLNILGGALADRREFESAFARHGESAAVYLELGDRSAAASALSRQGSAARSAGDFIAAEALCQESLRLARESGDRSEVAWSCLHLAFVRLHQADYAAARDLFVQSVQLWDGSVSAGRCCGFAAQGLASIAASLGQAERALRLFGAAGAIDRVRWRPARPGLANPFGFTTHLSTTRWQALASRVLGEKAATEALSIGRAMSIEQAIAYAMDTAASE